MKSVNSIELAQKTRESVLEMIHASNSSHLGSSLSMIDIISVILSQIELKQEMEDGPDLIVSKGHAAAATYSALAHAGYLSLEELKKYSIDGSKLGGHVTRSSANVLKFSTGSLGHGLPFAVGRCLIRKRNRMPGGSFVILSDGECDEGSNWEAALMANHHKLGNLSVIIDRNGLQSLRGTEQTLRLEPLARKWRAFGWDVSECDGHNHSELKDAIFRITTSPRVTIAKTIKGYGVDFMQNSIAWHYKTPNSNELKLALQQVRNGQ